MTKAADRIAELEKRIVELENRIAMLEVRSQFVEPAYAPNRSDTTAWPGWYQQYPSYWPYGGNSVGGRTL